MDFLQAKSVKNDIVAPRNKVLNSPCGFIISGNANFAAWQTLSLHQLCLQMENLAKVE